MFLFLIQTFFLTENVVFQISSTLLPSYSNMFTPRGRTSSDCVRPEEALARAHCDFALLSPSLLFPPPPIPVSLLLLFPLPFVFSSGRFCGFSLGLSVALGNIKA